jgi:hypothetical protein
MAAAVSVAISGWAHYVGIKTLAHLSGAGNPGGGNAEGGPRMIWVGARRDQHGAKSSSLRSYCVQLLPPLIYTEG